MMEFLLSIVVLNFSEDSNPGPQGGIGCAAISLITLAHFEGKDIDFVKLLEDLPERSDGHSIEQLLTAARHQGIQIGAVKTTDRLPDRPFIAFLSPDPRSVSLPMGHFRPLDIRGRQFQSVEPREEPGVYEEREILQAPRFSGVILVIVSPVRKILAVFLLAIAVVWGYYLSRLYFYRRVMPESVA